MKQRTPIGSRKWREITDFDLKILSVIIIALSLVTIALAFYAFYLKMQKSKVEVVIREIGTNTNPPVEKTLTTATQTVIVVEPAQESTLTVLLPSVVNESTLTQSQVIKPSSEEGKQNKQTENLIPLIQATSTTDTAAAQSSQSSDQSLGTKVNQSATTTTAEGGQAKPVIEENKFLKDITKFDYNLLVSRMAENLPGSILTNAYVYVVDGETALKIAKITQNYVLDRTDSGKYVVVTPTNVMPELNPSKGFWTVKTDPISSSKEAFKSVVNLRTLGISAFSVSTNAGYVICFGIFTSENQAKNFYFSQDWVELEKYGYTKGAKVTKIGG
ncbi:hypothetical protein SAMN04488510_12225 [Fervidobacterium changbaicum]|uniref:Uncharacterized protein n=1 Tax=Fervidobacterium changbaicum TaxID=310769 RepID=A0ABX5QTG4_9BACT|nr:hypothetical protein [Fervidobacterium changbaicum]QAV33528.1 hypothetical protein CBS1_07215 [Fervidobacterium changbaicum]SDH62999.1 hypothetical protein SAMN04488510_12225 [Fervidobacterium changbaicum]